MLQFLSPLALVALAALTIPAVLHLWRPPPRTVRVGAIRFFTGPAVRRLTKLRWRELLLLAARLLLLAAVALLLSEPIWRKAPPTEPQRWALFEPGVALQGDALKRWRDLDDLGFEARELAAGFRRIPAPADADGNTPVATNVWSLLREVDARLPRGSEVVVFASDRAVTLAGKRPAMRRCKAEWVSASRPALPETAWISSARVASVPDGSASKLRVAVTKSNADRTQTIDVDVAAAAGQTALTGVMQGWSVDVSTAQGGELAARLSRADGGTPAGPAVLVSQPKELRVAIRHSAERAEDARMRAAIRAVAETSGRAVSFSDEIAGANWIIWLNDEPPARDVIDEVTHRGATLLSDAENSEDAQLPVATSIEAAPLHPPVALFRRVAPTADAGTAFWTDGFGTPLLAEAREGSGRRVRFFSRFHPEWNDLPRSSALAAALQPLLVADHSASVHDQAQDQRRAHPSQGSPAQAAAPDSAGEVALPATSELVDLHTALWLACIALFAVERGLSHRAAIPRRSEPVRSRVHEERVLVEHA